MPRWWLELKATVSGAAEAGAAGGDGRGGGGILLGHRRLSDWAGQLYGGGKKMDEDALRAAVAWMEERGVLSQLTMGEAQFHGMGDAGSGPYYRLHHREREEVAASQSQVPAAVSPRHLATGPGPPPGAPHYGAAAVGGMPPSPRYSGASAVERAGRSAAQQLMRERNASNRASEAKSLDR